MSDLPSIPDYLNELCGAEGAVDEVVSESISNLKSKISEVEVELKVEEKKEEVKEPTKVGTELAERAVDTYKTKIKKPEEAGKDTVNGEVVDQPVTKASREMMKATIRSLTNRQTSASCAAPGPASPVVSPLALEEVEKEEETLEEYRARVFESFGLTEGKSDRPLGVMHPFARGVKQERGAKKDEGGKYLKMQHTKKQNKKEADLEAHREKQRNERGLPEETNVALVQEQILELTDRSWMEVDRVVRTFCLEHDIVVKEMNRTFKEATGLYPDKWAQEQVVVEECGWMPLDEAHRINQNGMVYEVSFTYRGSSHRYKFFWPSLERPSREEMQRAVEGIYPRARLMAFYPASVQDDNFLVMVPPMTENYVAYHYNTWFQLDEEANEAFHLIAEELGEPVSAIMESEEGYSVSVCDHDTGEEETVFFGEGIFRVKKRTPEEKKAAERTKKINELERLMKHASNKHSDVANTKRTVKTEGAAWTRKAGQNPEGGLNEKGRKSYERENPGSDLKRPQPEGGKRRTSYCARSKGQQKMHNIDCSKTPDKRICKARRKWNC